MTFPEDGNADSVSSAADFAFQALVRQQAAARRRGLFPSSSLGKSLRSSVAGTGATAESIENTAENLFDDMLDDSNLGALRWQQQPGMAKSDVYDKQQGPKKLEVIFSRLVDELGWGTNLSLASLSDSWPQVIGIENARHCWVESFDRKRGILRLGTASQVWAAQFRLLLPHLEAEITKFVGHGVINQVIVLGPEATAKRESANRVNK